MLSAIAALETVSSDFFWPGAWSAAAAGAAFCFAAGADFSTSAAFAGCAETWVLAGSFTAG